MSDAAAVNTPDGEHLYYDVETDGLLPELTVIHSIAITDLKTGEEFYYGPAVDPSHEKWTPLLGNPTGTVSDGVRRLEGAYRIIAHNQITFDILAIEKLYPDFKRPPQVWDSFVAAKVVWPYDVLAGPDFDKARKGLMPMSLVKRHSLKAWGYRLGDNKDDYDGDRTKYPEPSDRPAKKGDERFDRRWDEWNPWLASYMMQDNRPGVKLWKLIEERIGWTDKPTAVTWPLLTMEMEHEVARILDQQERDGISFDTEAAKRLERDLLNTEAAIKRQLIETFGSWWQPSEVIYPKVARNVKRTDLPDVTIRRVSEKTGKELAPYVGPPTVGYDPEAPYVDIEWITFSPASRDHLGQRLQAVFGWKPKKFGANGKPTVDETVLEEIPEAIVPPETRQLILDFFVVSKTLGMVSRGANAWLHLVDPVTNKIHGRMDPAGAITGRGTHMKPNLSQVPSVNKEKVEEDGRKFERVLKGLAGRYGWECKELFIADPGWELTDTDASSLELIMLGHYMHPHDGGAFSQRVCDETRDPHQEHADMADMTRADAKTTTYLKVFGGGAYKLSLSTSVLAYEIPEYLAYKGLPMILRNLAKRFDQDFVDKLDDNQKARIAKAKILLNKFDEKIEGLKEVTEAITEAAGKGWLKGFDGRKMIVRKAYSALNTLLQSAGAQAVKLWMVLTHRELKRRGLVYGRDFRQVLWVHDALTFTHKPGLGPLILEVAFAQIKEAGRMLGLRGELRASGHTGLNWAETH